MLRDAPLPIHDEAATGVAADAGSRARSGWLVAAVGVVLVLTVAIHVDRVINTTVVFDDAFIANVAKSLAMGHGYSSAQYRHHPFDPEITTGPLLVLPAAAVIRLFGPAPWAPQLTYALCFWTLLVVLIRMLSRRLGSDELLCATALLAVGLLLYTVREFGLLGEVPAGLLVSIAALLLMSIDGSPSSRPVLAGIVLGLAATTKAIALLSVPPILAWLVVRVLARRRSWHDVGDVIAGLGVIFVSMEVWKLLAVGSGDAWRQVKIEEALSFTSTSTMSGIATLVGALTHPWILVETIRRNAGELSRWWGGWHLLLAGLNATVIAVAVASPDRRSAPRSAVDEAGRLLLLAALFHALWWVCLSPTGWFRHLLPAIIYWWVATAMLVSAGIRHRLPALTAIALLALTLSFQVDRTPILDRRREGLTRKAATVEAAKYLTSMRADWSVVLLGCGWWHNPDLDYLMPTVATFRDCLRTPWPAPNGLRPLLVRTRHFNWEKSAKIEAIRAACEQRVLFRNSFVVISDCSHASP